jgi:hypothetical protein
MFVGNFLLNVVCVTSVCDAIRTSPSPGALDFPPLTLTPSFHLHLSSDISALPTRQDEAYASAIATLPILRSLYVFLFTETASSIALDYVEGRGNMYLLSISSQLLSNAPLGCIITLACILIRRRSIFQSCSLSSIFLTSKTRSGTKQV